jgi:hypothetical protein
MINSIRTKFILLLFINVIILSLIYFVYSPKIPLNNNIIVSSSIRTDYDISSNRDIKYIMGYIKSFSPNILYDVSVHVEYNNDGGSDIASKFFGVLNPGEVKTYVIKVDGGNIKIIKEWATYSLTKY